MAEFQIRAGAFCLRILRRSGSMDTPPSMIKSAAHSGTQQLWNLPGVQSHLSLGPSIAWGVWDLVFLCLDFMQNTLVSLL